MNQSVYIFVIFVIWIFQFYLQQILFTRNYICDDKRIGVLMGQVLQTFERETDMSKFFYKCYQERVQTILQTKKIVIAREILSDFRSQIFHKEKEELQPLKWGRKDRTSNFGVYKQWITWTVNPRNTENHSFL